MAFAALSTFSATLTRWSSSSRLTRRRTRLATPSWGLTARYGLVYLVFTEVEAGVELELRFITARRAEPWMVEEYEENRRKR